MEAFYDGHYVPILLTKQGERDALRDTPASVKASITPLLVVSPIDWDFDTDSPKKNVDDHLSRLPDQLIASWGTDPAFVDTQFLDDDAMASGGHPLAWLTEQAADRGLVLVPAVSPDRSAAYVDAVIGVVKRHHEGLCLRLPISQWPATAGYEAIEELLDLLDLGPDEVHLVLDLADETGAAAFTAVTSELRSLRDLHDWRSLTVAAAAMPKEMPAGSGLHVLPRDDWRLYRQVLASKVPPSRFPTFGDYAIANPDPVSDVDPKIMNISATLRYTAADDWLIAKGGLYKGNGGRSLGGAAVPPACRLLQAHPGVVAPHCGFEAWVASAAAGGPPGSPMIWRREGTRHHLQLVTEQIASLVGS